MARRMLSHCPWQHIKPLLPREKGQHGRPYVQHHRTTLEGILWVARTGAPWRDLPAQFGKWGTVCQRFHRWVQGGVFDKVFASRNQELNLDVIMVDGPFIKGHPHGTGAPKADAHPNNRELTRPWGEVAVGSPPNSWR